MLTGLPGVTLALVGGPILTKSSNPALRGVNLEVVGGPPQVSFINEFELILIEITNSIEQVEF